VRVRARARAPPADELRDQNYADHRERQRHRRVARAAQLLRRGLAVGTLARGPLLVKH